MKVVIPSTGHMTHGFIGYYTASRLLLEGKFGPQIYDDDWFTRQVHAIVKQPINEILLPKAEEYHFTLLLIPAVILLDDLVRHPSTGGFFSSDGLLLGMALFLLVVPFRYDDLSLSGGWLALLAYPRLYGAWLMWWVALRRMRAARMENYG